MAIKPDHRYSGYVGSGSQVVTFDSGSVAYQINLTCEDGNTYFMAWLTPKNKERVEKMFKDVLGVDPVKLRNPNYVEFDLAQEIEGKEVSFEARTEEYKGKTSVKVAFLSKKREGRPAAAMAEFFGGSGVTDDVPF